MSHDPISQTHPALTQPLNEEGSAEAVPTVRVVRPADFDANTVQTPGMQRFAAISGRLVGSKGMWAGLTVVDPAIESAPHHHGEQETVIYIKSGHARIVWGDHLEHQEAVEAGSFIFIPPYLLHQEINPSPDEPSEWVIVRNGPEAVVINLIVPPTPAL